MSDDNESTATRTATPPLTPTEQAVSEIWQEILGVEEIGLDDKFFEIGGTSLKAILMFSMLNEQFPGRLTAADLFKRTTIREMSEYIAGRAAGGDEQGVEL